VRELFHVIERAAVMCSAEVIDVADLPPALAATPLSPRGAFSEYQDLPLRDAVRALERQMIERALERSAGNRAEAARLLGIARPQLYAKMDDLGMTEKK
jgi:two-component system nitrogen regulation response regulator GlnG/two-component system response regulator AtoC